MAAMHAHTAHFWRQVADDEPTAGDCV